jgi:hypothetical protein
MPNEYFLPVPSNCPVTQTWERHKQRAIENGWAWKPGMAGKTWYYPGIDYAPDEAGDVVITAAQRGKVMYAGPDKYQGLNGGYGRYVMIDHGDGDTTYYAHLNEAKVKVGDRVEAGQPIGIMGWTGNVWPEGPAGRHLHFELRRSNIPFNPAPLFVATLIGTTAPPVIKPTDPEVKPDQPFTLPTIPVLPVLRISATSLFMRSTPVRDPGNKNKVGTLTENEEVSVIEIIQDGDDIWARIGHKQYIAMRYKGVIMGAWKDAI